MDRVPTYDDLRNMKYRMSFTLPPFYLRLIHLTTYKLVRSVLYETLRLFPPVPVNVRASSVSAPVLIPNPIVRPMYIPPDKEIIYNVFIIHRRKDHWGSDADVFDPMRWIDERRHRMTQNPLMFVPFNAGPRIVRHSSTAYFREN